MSNYKRYIRNIGQNALDEASQNKLIDAKILVVGAGVLGSGVVMNLAALGIETIKLIDDKKLQDINLNSELIHKYKNINRAKVISAKEWVNEFNPNIRFEIDKIRLNELNYYNIISDCDIIVDCLDSYDDKFLLNKISHIHNIPLVHGYCYGFEGHLTTIIPSVSGCLECILVHPKKELKNSPTLAPCASIISGLMANEVLKIITHQGDLLLDKMLMYNGKINEFKTLNYSKSLACKVCSK